MHWVNFMADHTALDLETAVEKGTNTLFESCRTEICGVSLVGS